MTIYNIIHGPEIWLAIAIWGIGAMSGIAATWIAIAINDRREKHEPDSFNLDNSDCGVCGTSDSGAPDSRGGRG